MIQSMRGGRDPFITPKYGDEFKVQFRRREEIRRVLEVTHGHVTYFDRKTKVTIERHLFLKWIRKATVTKREDVRCGTCRLFSPFSHYPILGNCEWRVLIECPPNVRIEGLGQERSFDEGCDCPCWTWKSSGAKESR